MLTVAIDGEIRGLLIFGEYPLVMMMGRVLSHYNTRAMTGKTKGLMEIEGNSFIELNYRDADALNIKKSRAGMRDLKYPNVSC